MWSKPIIVLNIVVMYLGVLEVTFSAEIICYKGSLHDYDSVLLDKAVTILNSSCYDSTQCNAFFVFGYEGSPKGHGSTTMVKAMMEELGCNTFMLDWSKEASSIINNTIVGIISYPGTAFEVGIMGEKFGNALVNMAKINFNLSKTHLIGHSLGAHLCGDAGRTVNKNNMKIMRITGLDPASPFFEKPPLFARLEKTNAEFVDCVHTDYGGYGVNTSTCDQDTYIHKTADKVQPGCPVGILPPLSSEGMCSHIRALQACADALKHQKSLIGCSAKNYSDWLAGKCDTHKRSYVCDKDIDKSATGNFFINVTNPTPVYGQGENGLEP